MYLRFSEHFSGERAPGCQTSPKGLPPSLKEASLGRDGASADPWRNFLRSAKEGPKAEFSPFPLSLF